MSVGDQDPDDTSAPLRPNEADHRKFWKKHLPDPAQNAYTAAEEKHNESYKPCEIRPEIFRKLYIPPVVRPMPLNVHKHPPVQENETTLEDVCESVKPCAPKNNREEGKPRPSLLPMDVLINYLCPAYEEGLIKYKRESWRRGFLVSDMFDAADRHLSNFFYEHEDWDPDAWKLGIKKHHLAGALFSILSILHTLDTRPELDDRPGGAK
jgi:dATP/dGTP diphosphohydrolase, N-terminal